jgi:rod shape-determining protein MreC
MMSKIDAVKGFTYSITSKWAGYFGLKKENEALAKENSALLNKISMYESVIFSDPTAIRDTLSHPGRCNYIFAEVINNSTNRQHNTFIINAGSKQRVEPEIGVISEEGVVGVVHRVSSNYSTVMSLLNIDFKLSAKLKRTGYFGPLTWDGKNIREAIMIEVPQHAEVLKGDTIVTSGYSAIFPEGIMVGTVKSAEVKKGNFYEIKVLLSADLSRMHYVNVVDLPQRDEIKEHER